MDGVNDIPALKSTSWGWSMCVLWGGITVEVALMIYVASQLIFYSWWLNSSESLDNLVRRSQVFIISLVLEIELWNS